MCHISKFLKLSDLKDDIFKKIDPLGVQGIPVHIYSDDSQNQMLDSKFRFKHNPKQLYVFIFKGKGGHVNFEAIKRALQPYQQ